MGPVVLCFGVVDEADIIADFIAYHRGIGIDAFVVADLGSTDGTLDILRRHVGKGWLHLTELADAAAEAGGHHSWLGSLVATARERYHAEWCLLGDPDEFWVMPGDNAAAHLATAPSPIVVFPRFNIVPRRETGSDRATDFRSFDLIVRRPLQFVYDLNRCTTAAEIRELASGHPPDILRFVAPKLAARPEAIASIDGINVIASQPDTLRHVEQSGYIAHYQTRSLAQWREKARRVTRYADINAGKFRFGRTWIRLAVLYRNGLIDADFAREMLAEEEIAWYLRRGVIEPEPSLAQRLAARAPRAG